MASDWSTALAGQHLEVLGPRAVGDTHGHAGPADALAAAGGPPRSAPEAPLLVLVNDADRATDSGPALRAVRDALQGRPFRVLVATGSHRFTDAVKRRHEERLRAGAGEDAEIAWHDALEDEHVDLGPACFDARLAAADDVLAIGSVEPHWFAGLTGAHKTLTIGLLERTSIARNHRHAMEHGSGPLVLAGNPVFEDIEQHVRAACAGRTVVALQHLEGRWFAGEPLESLEAAAAAARERWLHETSRAYDLLVAVVGPPLDGSLYQAEKGVKNSEFAVRDGGAIVLDARCPKGVGPPRFAELMGETADAASAREWVAQHGYQLGDHKAVRLRQLLDRGVRLAVLAPDFPREAARTCGFDVVESQEAAAAWAGERVGTGVHAALVTDAAHMVVRVR